MSESLIVAFVLYWIKWYQVMRSPEPSLGGILFMLIGSVSWLVLLLVMRDEDIQLEGSNEQVANG